MGLTDLVAILGLADWVPLILVNWGNPLRIQLMLSLHMQGFVLFCQRFSGMSQVFPLLVDHIYSDGDLNWQAIMPPLMLLHGTPKTPSSFPLIGSATRATLPPLADAPLPLPALALFSPAPLPILSSYLNLLPRLHLMHTLAHWSSASLIQKCILGVHHLHPRFLILVESWVSCRES